MQQIKFITNTALDFQTTEAYKNLRTNIQFCGQDIKVVLVTSTFPNDGKTTTAMRLAMSFAEMGKSTILLDCDLRKSELLSGFTSEQRVYGLTHFLTGMQTLDNCISETDVKNLHILFSGAFPPNPVELMSTKRFETLMNVLREHYDYVIVDAPPLGSVVDAAVLAQYCDGALYVMRQGKVKGKFAQKIVAQIKMTKCRVLGVVFSRMDAKKLEYGKGYYGKGYYSKYYK